MCRVLAVGKIHEVRMTIVSEEPLLVDLGELWAPLQASLQLPCLSLRVLEVTLEVT